MKGKDIKKLIIESLDKAFTKRLEAAVIRIKTGFNRNKPVLAMAAVIAVQLPFVVVFFTRNSSQIEVAAARNAGDAGTKVEDSKAVEKDAPEKPANDGPLLQYRDDPFLPLDGAPSSAADRGNDKSDIMKVFGDSNGSINIPVVNGVVSSSPEVGPNSLPPLKVGPAVVVDNSRSVVVSPPVKLVGIARCGSEFLAVFEMQDKTSVHVGRGDNIAGTDYTLKDISINKVVIARQVSGATRQNTVLIGEEYRG